MEGIGKRILHTIMTLIVVGFFVVMMFKVFGPLFVELIEDYANIDWSGLVLWAGCVLSGAVGSYYTLCYCIARWMQHFKKGGKEE